MSFSARLPMISMPFYSSESIDDLFGLKAERLYQLGRYLVWSRIDEIRGASAAVTALRHPQ
jgi:hypothetical protein